MNAKHVVLLVFSTISLVFTIMVGWELSLQDRIAPGQPAHVYWEHFLTAALAIGITGAISSMALLRVIARMKRTQSRLEEEIDRRRRAEAAQESGEKLLGQAQRVAKLAHWRWCFATRRLTSWSSEFPEIFGMTDAQVDAEDEGQFDWVHPEDRDNLAAVYKAATPETPGFDIQYRIIRSDGQIRYLREVAEPEFDSDGRVAAHFGIIQDITDQRHAETALRASEALLKQAVRMGRMGHWEWDPQTRTYITCSEELAELYGYTADEYMKTFNDTDWLLEDVHPDDWKAYQGAITASEEYKGPYEVEFRETTASGEFRFFREYGEPVHDENGRPLWIMGIIQDITEFKKTEEALEESKRALEARIAELEEAQRKLEQQGAELVQLAGDLTVARDDAEAANRAKSEFLATMSHEIRTPMNGVLGMASALLSGQLSPQQRNQVQIVKESGEALLELLNDILDLSKIEAGKMVLESVDFSLRDVLKATEALWRSRAEAKGLSFTLGLDLGGEERVRADETRLRQVLFNLVGNAIKFTESGAVSLSVSRDQSDGGRLLFKVSDTGIGVTKEQQANLFNPFEQADASTTRKYGGSGLGLAISKHLVALMGGEIGVDSVAGQGSTFWFTIAVEPARSDGLATEDEGEEATCSMLRVGRTLRVLVAEDNHVNQLVLDAMLKPLKCELDMVANGLEALAAVQAKEYDVVLMDVQMPEMDGVTATRKIRTLSGAAAQVPIIALTANAMKGDRESYLGNGMTDYVSKPIDAQAMLAAILRCCDKGLLEGSVAGPADALPEPAETGMLTEEPDKKSTG